MTQQQRSTLVVFFLFFCTSFGGFTQQYSLVFPQDKINELHITLTQEQWTSIQAEMKSLFHSDFGASDHQAFIPPPPNFLANGKMDGKRMPIKMLEKDPSYQSVSLRFKDSTWTKVDFRLKGNSSLMMSWRQGIYKLPFRLRFGKTKQGQSDFYGFHELSFSPALGDNSLMREKITATMFRQAGIKAPQTAYYRVYISFGETEKYCGIYTLVEVVDDTMIATQFGNKSGNIYKPESHFERFDSTEFEKKNNKKLADWRDIQSLIHVLTSEVRTRNPQIWRQQLEAVFNVTSYLKWLAINSLIVNWDTYGRMAHNFYLYNDPKEKLTWIPWDNNEALKDGMEMKPPQGMHFPPKMDSSFRKAEGMLFPPPMMGNRGDAGDLSHKNVSSEWPLIRFLLDDAVYQKAYKQAIKQVSEKVFTQKNTAALLQDNYLLLKPYVGQEEFPYSHLKSKDDFEKAFQELNTHIQKRMDAAKKYVSTP